MFQSTFPRGERPCTPLIPRIKISCFNPRSREGNDTPADYAAQYEYQFQSTFPRGERRALYCCTWRAGKVSIHVPARGTTTLNMLLTAEIDSVSIHVPARGTTWQLQPRAPYALAVSIHVPARGTTDQRRDRGAEGDVSIHVPARGTTYNDWFRDINYDVSIHVPARGTTTMTIQHCLMPKSFNPRSREGNDLLNVGDWLTGWMFQSTFPRGERLVCCIRTI